MAILADPLELPEGRLLALDLGQARIGVAACDEAGMLASPLAVLRRHPTRAEDFVEIAALVRRESVVGVLIGLPRAGGVGDRDVGVGAQARWTMRYAGRLAGVLTVPVAFWDETLTSLDAARLLHEGGGKAGIDAAAAALILADYLETRRKKAR